jgi:hypothetical protein
MSIRILFSTLSSGDKTPDAVNWANIGPGNEPQNNANQTLQNFDGSLDLEMNRTGSGLVYYSLNGGSFTFIADGGQVSVSDGDTLRWQVANAAPGTVSGTVTITNESDGSTSLDTFTYNVTLPL